MKDTNKLLNSKNSSVHLKIYTLARVAETGVFNANFTGAVASKTGENASEIGAKISFVAAETSSIASTGCKNNGADANPGIPANPDPDPAKSTDSSDSSTSKTGDASSATTSTSA